MSTEVVITGAGGFLGGAVARRLPAATLLLGPEDAPRDGVLQGDVEDAALLDAAFAAAEVVVHLAGPPSVAASFEQPDEFRRVHAGGTEAVVSACARHGVKRLIYVSSAEVYGQPTTVPVAEAHPLRPRSPYGDAKLAAEGSVSRFVGERVILRPFSVYGPGQSPRGVLHAAIEQALRGPRIRLATLSPVRDFCFVDDVAAAIALAAEVPLAGPVICNLGSGRGTSIGELAEAVAAVVGGGIVVEESGAQRPSDIQALVADVKEAAVRLSWRPSTDLAEGLRRTIAAQRLTS